MDILIGLVLCFVLLILTVQKGTFLGYTIFLCLLIFAAIAKRKGFSGKEILHMCYDGGKRSFLILQLFILISSIMSIWISSATLPTLMYYCLSYLSPQWFVLFTFLICSLVSFLIGSSFGSISTMGIAFMTLARGSNIPLALITGAIMSGVYFGDRGSPMSSAAALTASVCKADHMTNVKNMGRSCLLPLLASVVFYGIFSFFYPLEMASSTLPATLQQRFTIGPLMLLPAAILFLLPVLKVDVKRSMLVSIGTAFLLSLFVQHESALSVVKGMVFGIEFHDGPLQGVLKSGGIQSMLITYVTLFLSCGLAGIFEEIHAFDTLKVVLQKYNRSHRLRFGLTTIIAVLSCAFGCNQTIATIVTHDIMQECYEDNDKDHHQFSLDIANSTLLIAALVPWCIASFVPMSMLGVSGVGISYLPFAFYVYIVPVLSFLLFPACGRAGYPKEM